ncbi:MAG TPA: M48 family metalloprotease [bacterium]|nr:M48 family metalloprotease [bacterium]
MFRNLHLSELTHRIGVAVVGVALCALVWPAAVRADQTSDEVKLGAQIAKEIESHYRVVTDPEMVERVNRVSAALVRAVDRQDLTYHFKILDIPGPNALSLPGGYVYVTKGMMKFVRSDDELAAVLAHELTHVAHRHYYIQEARQKRAIPAMVVAAALSVLARSAVPLAGAQLAVQGAMSDYQRDLEKEADLTGISYLVKTSYSPVAMLTLLEHLAQVDKLTGQPDVSLVFYDHPKPDERVVYVEQDLKSRGIPIVRRIPEGYLRLALAPATPAAGQPVTVLVDGRPIIQLGATVNGQDPAERAQTLMAGLNAFFNTDPEPYDVRAVALLDRWSVIGGQTRLFEVTPEDVAYAKGTPKGLAETVRARLAEALAATPYYRKF